MKKQLLPLIALLVFGIIGVHFLQSSSASANVGAVNNFYNSDKAKRISIDIKPYAGEDGYHYYSLTGDFTDLNFGLYAGIQTNGNLGNGVDVGNVFLFSVWNAKHAYPAQGVSATPFGGEGEGYSLRKKYDWKVNTTYMLTIKRGDFDSARNGWRWSASITNKSNGEKVSLGDIVAHSQARSIRSGSAFHERFIGSTIQCSGASSNLEQAGVKFSNLSADTSISFNGNPAPNNVFKNSPCGSLIHMARKGNTAVTGFGIAESTFNRQLPAASVSPQLQSEDRSSPSDSSQPQETTPREEKREDSQKPDKPESNNTEADQDISSAPNTTDTATMAQDEQRTHPFSPQKNRVPYILIISAVLATAATAFFLYNRTHKK